MAWVSRITRIRLTTGTGSFREWTLTATNQDVEAGLSTVWTLAETTGGGAPPGAASQIDIRWKDTSGVEHKYFPNATIGSTFTTWMTSALNSGTQPKAGIIEAQLEVLGNSVGLTYQLNSKSDGTLEGGSAEQVPAGQTAVRDRGWTRGTANAHTSMGNNAFGGTNPTFVDGSPWEYNEHVYHRIRLTVDNGSIQVFGFRSQSLTHTLRNGAAIVSSASSTNGITDNTWENQFVNEVDDTWPAAITAVNAGWTVPNDALVGVPWTVLGIHNEETANFDPRLTAQWHFQKDRASFDTSFHDSSFKMLSPEVGQAAVKCKTARTLTGVNGLSVTLTADPINPGNNTTNSSTTATLDSESGWSGLVDIAPTGKPGGIWVVTADITAPANISNNSYLVNSTQNITVIAPNPAYRVAVGAGPLGSDDNSHWYPGLDLQIGGGLIDSVSAQLLTPGMPVPEAILCRFNTSGLLEYLEDNLDTWTALPANSTNAVNKIPLTRGDLIIPGADPRVYFLIIPGANTLDWGCGGIEVLLLFHDASGTPYSNLLYIDPVNDKNSHGKNSFDPTGLFM